jgi:hypothetical protein
VDDVAGPCPLCPGEFNRSTRRVKLRCLLHPRKRHSLRQSAQPLAKLPHRASNRSANMWRIHVMRMCRLLIVAIAMVVAACMAKPAAADDVPQVTRDFLPYCKTHLDSCYEAIATIIISNAASQKTFCVPQSVLVSKATYTASHRRVIKWMTDHPESYGQSTNANIRAALVALYPCQ